MAVFINWVAGCMPMMPQRSFWLMWAAGLFMAVTAVASESSLYNFSWLDKDKEVYVLQNRQFFKKGTMNLAVGAGMTLSGAFVDAQAVQGRIGFYPLENWGIELVFSANRGEENDNAKAVRMNVAGGNVSGSVPFRRITKDYFGGMIQWAPFYAKVNTFNKVLYVDWYLGLGFAKLDEENNRLEISNTDDKTVTQESHNGILWGTGLRVFITKRWHARLDLTGIHYTATKATEVKDNGKDKSYYNNYDLALSVGMSI